MGIRRLGSAFFLLASLTVWGCHQDCPKCGTPLPPTPAPPSDPPSDPPSAPAGGLGIPYGKCATKAQCNSTALANSKLDPSGNLVAKDLCEGGWCRGYYNAASAVCLDGDTIKCAKSPNVFGTATCNNGSFGICQ